MSSDETIQEYAGRWATTKHLSGQDMSADERRFLEPCFERVIFAWAKDDPNSPVARMIEAGASEEDAEKLFLAAWDFHSSVLRKLDSDVVPNKPPF
jgi:hypothetical protein